MQCCVGTLYSFRTVNIKLFVSQSPQRQMKLYDTRPVSVLTQCLHVQQMQTSLRHALSGNVGVTGGFWHCDWSWLHRVCRELTLYISLSGFVRLAITPALSLRKRDINSRCESRKQEVLPARVKLIFTCPEIWHSVLFDIFSESFFFRLSCRPRVTTCS